MKQSTLEKIKTNLHSGNAVTVPYSELRHWYEIEGADLDEEYSVNLTSEGDDYWLEINSGKIADEIIINETTGKMADWLYNR